MKQPDLDESMDNLADISLDLVCALKFSPPGGYEIEDIAAIENACWQTLLHSLNPIEQAAVVRAAERQISELELEVEEGASLPEYLENKLAALKDLVAHSGDCTEA